MARPSILLLVIGACTMLGEVRGYGYNWFNLPPPVVIAEDCVKSGEEGKSESAPEEEAKEEPKEESKEEPKEGSKESSAESKPAEASGEKSEKTEEAQEEGDQPKVSYWSLFPPRNYVKSYYQPYVSSYAVAPNYGYSYGYTTGSSPYFYPSYGRMVLLPNTWSRKGGTLRYISL